METEMSLNKIPRRKYQMTHLELKKIREDKKLSKTDFAKLIGITAMLLGRYESGKISIPDNIAEKALAVAAAKVAADVVEKKVEKKAKTAVKTTVKKAVGDTVKKEAKKVVKKAGKKVAKDAAKAAVGVAAVAAAKKAVKIQIQSLLGGTITPEEVLKRVPEDVDEVYIKPEENKAYWVKGEETGEIDLW